MKKIQWLKINVWITIWLFFALGTAAGVMSQPVTIEGIVVEELSGEPIQGANVYLENTTTGTSTLEDGTFSFATNRTGPQTILISFIGYHKASYPVELSDTNRVKNLRFELRPDRIEMDDIVISVDNSEWQENYEAFVNEFIGSNQLASETTIQNQWVLDFIRTPSGELFATASAPLIIENRGLGYRIDVKLNDFMWKLNSDTGLMLLDLQFSELTPNTPAEREKWEKNREGAFQGSLSHFLKSLYEDRLSRNQFEVVRFMGKQRDKIYKARRSREIILALIRNGYNPADLGEKVKAFHIRRPVDILYGNKSARTENRERARLSPQNESGIFLVRKDGTLVNPRAIGVEGYWRTERLANQLPFKIADSLLIN
ncbi:MAG: hypothetical protein GVY08_01315 [Bacteroidetes bacterium]|jgi:hypothetical protein|nr:hypothetical protein [Bacteroidota bacterium]